MGGLWLPFPEMCDVQTCIATCLEGSLLAPPGVPTCQPDAPTPRAPESQEAQSDLRPKGQKRTSPREVGKGQQGSKKAKPSDTARVFTLRKRTRVS